MYLVPAVCVTLNKDTKYSARDGYTNIKKGCSAVYSAMNCYHSTNNSTQKKLLHSREGVERDAGM